MKKIIMIIISMMILMPSMANAQVHIGEKQSTMKKVATISMSWYDLYMFNGEYLLSLKSTNQFDDNYWLHLGTKEEAIESLNSLIDLCSSLGKDDMVEISNGLGKTYRVSRYGKGLSFDQKEPGMAGFTYIYKMYLTKTLNVIKK